jgi:hypothetical protein
MSRLSPTVAGMMMFGLGMMESIKAKSEEKKKWILEEWERSKNYPRKKKKKVRKHLQLDWSIASWNPFEF